MCGNYSSDPPELQLPRKIREGNESSHFGIDPLADFGKINTTSAVNNSRTKFDWMEVEEIQTGGL